MARVTLVVREIGRLKVDYSLDFELPEVPAIGSYISIQRPDKKRPFGEDLIVRNVWWRLDHPDAANSTEEARTGKLNEILVECDPASGPYSSEDWLRKIEAARSRGAEVDEFQMARVGVREGDLDF